MLSFSEYMTTRLYWRNVLVVIIYVWLFNKQLINVCMQVMDVYISN